MTTRTVISRLARVEDIVGAASGEGQRKIYFCQGPAHMDGHQYLRSVGYDLPESALVVNFVAAVDGKPADLPPADLTPRYAPANALPEFGG